MWVKVGWCMQLTHMNRDDAKHLLRCDWERKTKSYQLSASDAFTDGFWAGRLWAMARVLGALGAEHRALLMEKLEVYENEATTAGV
jgi:hypothetical protein